MSPNRLADETSPYLLQHKDNPVHWHPWGADVLDDARAENCPILLSIGYAACHWCHVMAHESFENDDIAALMNAHFINVKVDREERPDVDAIYQSALALMGKHGGWPLTMFLTPDGEPFWGGTYFPPTPKFGRPGFPELLRGIASAYGNQADQIQNNVAALRDALAKLSSPTPGKGLTTNMVDDAASMALRLIDPINGGTSGVPKFPQPVFFRFLWRAYKRTGSALFKDAVTTSISAMCRGGIYDHLGGGFTRYSTDERWLVPHFEKMLYDNALLIDLMSEVWQDTRDPVLAERIREAVEWANAEMRIGDDHTFAYAAALDADSEGVEGKFYVWSEAEIDSVLGTASALFKAAYDVTPHGNWEGHVILNRSHAPTFGNEDHEAKLADARRLLFKTRRQRIPPARDDKVLADWNGLMIAALAQASTTFGELKWLEDARAVFRFVVERMANGDRLYHSWCAGTARHPATIDDYANMARAAITLYEIGGDADTLEHAERWVAVADRHYWDSSGGGYYFSADNTTDVIIRSKSASDHATPAGNGTMVEVLARLYHLTGNDAHRQRVETLVQLFSGENPQYLLTTTGLLAGYELLERGVQVVVTGPPDDPGMAAFAEVIHTAGAPLKVVSRVVDPSTLPVSHPAHGKTAIDGQPTVYICAEQTCGPPLTDSTALREALVRR